uniref:DUF148 domain-containing protein n=1 Tax=Parastrongyloides trichosuri TaxID=131310 RepID=A0A0N5A2Z6_PARTI
MIKEVILIILYLNIILSQYPFPERYPIFSEPINNYGYQNQFLNPNIIPLTNLEKYQIEQLQKSERNKVIEQQPIAHRNGVETFIERLADKLPEITEKVIKIIPQHFDKDNNEMTKFRKYYQRKAFGTEISRSDDKSSETMVEINDSFDTVTKPDIKIEREDNDNVKFFNPRQPSHEGPFSFINSLPSPDTIFGFTSLIGENNNNNYKVTKRDDKDVDLINIQGIPIEKDEDDEIVSYEKPAEKISSVYVTTTSLPLTTESGAGDFAKNILSKFLPSPGEIKKESSMELIGNKKKTTEPTPENLISALLNGKLDKIDWLSAFLGGNNEDEHSPNPLSQLFKGGLLGSATNFDAPIVKNNNNKKTESREFH